MRRLLAIADPHGNYDKLVELLNKVRYSSTEDQLVLLGDYVDRGSQPMKTLLFAGELMDEGAKVLIGNHDSMFYELLKAGRLFEALYNSYYIKLGMDKTVKDYYALPPELQKRVVEVLEKLIPYYQEDKYIFVHGGVNASLSVDKNDFHDIIWLREEFYDYKAYENKIVVFGHSPTCFITGDNNFTEIWYDEKFKDKIGIDCACVYGGKLACLDLTNNIQYYV